jgi:thiol-disulfide isomerase/thioredoxin
MNADRTFCWILCGVMLGAGPLASGSLAARSLAEAAEPPQGTLYWTNGDDLAGTLVGATNSHLTWHSPGFQLPFHIDQDCLQGIQFQAPERVERAGKFQVTTRTGDTLFGDLLRIGDNQLVLDSTRSGQLAFPLTAVRGFRHLDNPALIYVGPKGLQGWRTLHPTTRLTEWVANADDTLTTRHVGAELFQDLRLPELAEIDITLSWERKPGFVIAFAAPKSIVLSKYTAKLETWEDEVVLQTLTTDGDFDQLMTLDDNIKSLRLRLLWDQKTGELSAYAENGSLLGKRSAGGTTGIGKTAIYLQNKGTDLTLTSIQVNHWNGAPSANPDDRQGNILLNDGSVITGSIQGFEAGTGRFLIQDREGVQRQIPLNQVASGSFDDGSNAAEEPQTGVRVSYFDGTCMHGTIHSIQNGMLKLATSYSQQPVACRMDGLRELVFLGNQDVDPDLGGPRLELGGIELHGQLAASEAPDVGVGWRPLGSRNASPLDFSKSAVVVLAEGSPEQVEASGTLRDVLYLQGGDVIPCRVHSISESHVYAASVFGNKTPIPRESVRAIELAATGTPVERGFRGRGWEVSGVNQQPAVEIADDQAIFKGNATLTHPGMLLGQEIRFSLAWNKSIPVTLTIGFGEQAATSSIMFYLADNQVYLRGMQALGGQHLQAVAQGQNFRDCRSDVRLVLDNGNLRIHMDDRQVYSQRLGGDLNLGRGLRLDIQQMARIEGLQMAEKTLLTIADLRVGQVGNSLESLLLNGRQLDPVLTVPRMRKQSPPTHVLVARNGDLLRGRLLDANDQRIRFTSRMDDIEIPRERVAGIVWVTPPDEETEAWPIEGNALAVFHSGVTFLFVAREVQGDRILGEHSVFGACEVPTADLRELRIGPSESEADPPAFADWHLQPAKEPRFAGAATGAGGASDEPGLRFGIDSPLVGTIPEAVAGVLLDGSRFRLSEHEGKVVILDFWATWCGPCVKSLPEILAAVRELPQDEVVLVGVNVQETAEVVQTFIDARELALPVLLDRESVIARQFRVEAIPQTVLIGPEGKIQRVYVGADRDLPEELQAAVKRLLEAKEASTP